MVVECARFREGFNGLAQLREPYDVNISVYGMPRVFPGQMIYVDPIGMGSGLGSPSDNSSIAYLLGFGGYHQIIKIKNSIKSGDYTTDIEAKWISTGNATDPRRGTLIGEGTSGGTCGVLDSANLGVDNQSLDIGFDDGPWPEEPEVEIPAETDNDRTLRGDYGEERQSQAAHTQASVDVRMGGLN